MANFLRCAKDLGRVVAIAWLAGRGETTRWGDLWRHGISSCFGGSWQVLASNCGQGLRELLAAPTVFHEAWQTTNIGLLGGLNVSEDILRATADRLLLDVIDPIERGAT